MAKLTVIGAQLIRLKGFVNVYEDDYIVGLYATRKEADADRGKGRIACVQLNTYVPAEEGVVPNE